jgi:4-azaleucine resistance transporter AzlC
MQTSHSPRLEALRAAFPKTIPIIAGFLFTGFSYGFYMQQQGFSFWYPTLMALTIYGGSLEFVTVSMLLSPFAPLQSFLLALMIQARHLFYGIAMLDRYKGMGWKKFYLIFGMCDETFAIIYSTEPPAGINRGWFMFWITLLDHIYWIFGAFLGGVFGSFVTIDTKGIDFVMTSMFVVIFLEQLRKENKPDTALIGFAVALICLKVFGPDSFLIPTMIGILAIVTLLRPVLEKRGGRTA